jgi:NDP-sugar pyrophosphorylase family protein
MELKAILIQGGHPNPESERWAGLPISGLEMLGKPVFEHIADRLLRFGVDAVTLVTTQETAAQRRSGRRLNVITTAPAQLWRSAETVFNLYAQAGAEIVLAIRLGPYIEIDVDTLLHFHHERKNRVTRVLDPEGRSLDFCVIDASRRNDGACLFRSALRETRLPSEEFRFNGYCNALEQISDLRRLTQDALMLDCELRPAGTELKPGVWAADGASIAKDARLVAPCFIGANAKVRSGAVITRMSAVEHDAEVDLGTMIEDSSVMPLSYVGPGLDICHSVVGYSKVANLPRNATVAICDPKLAAELSPSPLVRKVGGLAETVSKAAAAIAGSFTSKHTAPAEDTAKVEHGAPAAERSQAAAKAS